MASDAWITRHNESIMKFNVNALIINHYRFCFLFAALIHWTCQHKPDQWMYQPTTYRFQRTCSKHPGTRHHSEYPDVSCWSSDWSEMFGRHDCQNIKQAVLYDQGKSIKFIAINKRGHGLSCTIAFSKDASASTLVLAARVKPPGASFSSADLVNPGLVQWM